jgi:threonine synthase
MSIWHWAHWLEPVPPAARVTLGEGNTPLVRSRRIGPRAGMENLFFKLETVSPSGSYKDRFAVVAISHMVAHGRRHCVATSSGNTGAALAAYCAAAGIGCEIAIVETAPADKLKQMFAYGAELFRVKGFGIDADITARVFARIQELGSRPGAAVQISSFKHSPAGMSGVQSISFELAEQLPKVDHVFCPAGGGGLVVAVNRGFARLVEAGRLPAAPAVEVVQPVGNDTIAGPLREGAGSARTVQCTTAVSGLQVPTVIDGDDAIRASRSAGGSGHLVSDQEVWAIQQRLASEEGIFCEPAGAVACAGAVKAGQEKRIAPDAVVVCLVTGSGFKDQPSVDRMLQGRVCPLISLDELDRRASSG